MNTATLTRTEKRAYWAEQISAWEGSDLTQGKFCEQNDVSLVQFVYWRGLLKRKDKKQASVIKKIVPVQLSPSTPLQVAGCIRIKRPCGLVIELPASLAIAQLESILKVIAA